MDKLGSPLLLLLLHVRNKKKWDVGAASISTFFFLLALQPPVGVVFYSPLVGFSLLAYEVS